jgi:hypothetical protein
LVNNRAAQLRTGTRSRAALRPGKGASCCSDERRPPVEGERDARDPPNKTFSEKRHP